MGYIDSEGHEFCDGEVQAEKKIRWADKVETPDGRIGIVTELDGGEYLVYSGDQCEGWFLPSELKVVG